MRMFEIFRTAGMEIIEINVVFFGKHDISVF